jgi:hypothetical protein
LAAAALLLLYKKKTIATMRKFQTAISFTIILAVTLVVLGLLSVRRHQPVSQDQAAGAEMDHPIMLCI